MGGWSATIVLLSCAFSASPYKIDIVKNMPDFNSWILPENILNLYPQTRHYDLATAEYSKPLFNNMFWMAPIKLEHTVELENDARGFQVGSNAYSTNSNILVEDWAEPVKNKVVTKEGVKRFPGLSEQSEYDDVIEAALEREAEARVEKEYFKQKYLNRNRRENDDESTNKGYQDSVQAKYAVVESKKSAEEPHGESSDYGHHSYAQYNDGGSHYEEYEPKKKKELHYHQHQHLHEHNHLQEHKHQHSDEHQDKHYHEHKQIEDHKHYHEAKHEHREKAEHYHKKYAKHQHKHYQEHKHDHKNEHWHQHGQEAWHEYKDKHEHYHKEGANHYHEEKARHGHNHHHKSEEKSKPRHNHWFEHKHGHNHHHDDKHYHDHKSDHYHQHKPHKKIRAQYKKHHKHG